MIKQPDIFDYILVGGGLQSSLLALAISYHQPTSSILMLEKNESLCGNHTWSFHETDVPPGSEWLGNIEKTRWPAYHVRFPGFERTFETPYCTIKSEHLAASVAQLSSDRNFTVETGVNVTTIDRTCVHVEDGTQRLGNCIVDCRGRTQKQIAGTGFQKFLGLELRLSEPWADHIPTLMDANIDQTDGFRFLYALPFSPKNILVEETFFSDNESLDEAESEKQIFKYVRERYQGSWEIVRKERGCLPMPYSSPSTSQKGSQHLAGGFAGGWFHAATGYSFPLAIRFANAVAIGAPTEALQRVEKLRTENQFQSRYARFLNRLLFNLVSPKRRFEIFRRFYKSLPDRTIERFYAHTFTYADSARILIGKPPGGLTPIRFLNSLRSKNAN